MNIDSLISDPGSVDSIIEAEENDKNKENLSKDMTDYISEIKSDICRCDKANMIYDPLQDLHKIDFSGKPDTSKFYRKKVKNYEYTVMLYNHF